MSCKKLKLLKKSQNKKLEQLYNGARRIYNKTVFLINETQNLYETHSKCNKYDNFSWLDTNDHHRIHNPSYEGDISEKYNNFEWVKDNENIISLKKEESEISIVPERNTKESVFIGKLEARDLLVPDKVLNDDPELKNTPSVVREGAVFEAIKNFKSARSNIKAGNIRHFTLGYKKKKAIKSWTVSIRRNIDVLDCKRKKIENEIKRLKKYFNEDVREHLYNVLVSSCIEILRQKDTIDPFHMCVENLQKILTGSVNEGKLNDIIKDIMIMLAESWINKEKNRRKFKCFSSFTDGSIFETTEEIPEINNDSFIHFDGFDYYLLLPYTYTREVRKEGYVLATDPGVRTYQTVYCPDGFIIRIGEGAGYKLARIGSIVNKLTRDLNQKKGTRKSRKQVKRRILKLRKRMLCLQTELHNKTSNLLTKIGRIICLPDFGTKKMSKRGKKRKISRKVVRAMMALGHFKHKEQMKTKSVQNDCIILHTKEPYTTKQCGSCGFLGNNIGSDKIYNCKRCNLSIGRDDTSSRNNLMCNIRHDICV